MTTTPTFIKDHNGNAARVITIEGIFVRYTVMTGTHRGRVFSTRFSSVSVITDPRHLSIAEARWQRMIAV